MDVSDITILCIDDEEIPRTLRKLILQKQGYQVVTAASGAEALEILDRESIDLVLSDQMMPGMTGTELAKTVKATRPTMPVILISGVNEIPADAIYADRFISKVGGPELLFKTVSEFSLPTKSSINSDHLSLASISSDRFSIPSCKTELKRSSLEQVNQFNHQNDDHRQLEEECAALIELIHHKAVEFLRRPHLLRHEVSIIWNSHLCRRQLV